MIMVIVMIDRYTRQQKINNERVIVKEKTINSYPTHCHEFYEIELIISGRGSYIIDGVEHRIENNMLFFMTPVDFHEVITEETQVITLMFMGEACDSDLLFHLTTISNLDSVKLSDDDARYLSAIMHELNIASSQNDEKYSFYLLNSILGKICRIKNLKRHGHMSRVQRAMLYVQNNFRYDIALSDVAADAGVTPSYMSSIFSNGCGINFKEYLNTIRYDYAKKLLEHSNMTVTDICFESGFCDYANFERQFKERFSVSPTQYRKDKKK